MAHTLYHTEGFIVESVNSGEANRFLWIYTKDFGLLGVHAQGVRYMKSKLRYSLIDMAYCSFTLVRGRDVWRLTSATIQDSGSFLLMGNIHKRVAFSRVMKLLKRLIHGEERDDVLFEILYRGYLSLQDTSVDYGVIKSIEIMLVIQILHTLGYLSLPEEYMRFIHTDSWSLDILGEISERKHSMVRIINDSLGMIEV